ncbi:monooxygenase 3 [Quercus suber]|uniref:Monooxygenase 3 n=1 Tax=Quercus suber TaxID=58331 RepID=A0AAW0JGS6_QUESU
MTLDIVQGGCATLEDSVVLVRCLAKALSNETSRESKDKDERELDEYKRIEMGLKKQREEVLIGCNGVNSVMARYLGFKKLAFTGRFSIRVCVDFKHSHGIEPKSI